MIGRRDSSVGDLANQGLAVVKVKMVVVVPEVAKVVA